MTISLRMAALGCRLQPFAPATHRPNEDHHENRRYRHKANKGAMPTHDQTQIAAIPSEQGSSDRRAAATPCVCNAHRSAEALEVLPQQRSLREALTMIVEMIVAEHSVAPVRHKAIEEVLPGAVRQLDEDQAHLQKRFSQVLNPFMRNVPHPNLSIYLMGIAAHVIIHIY